MLILKDVKQINERLNTIFKLSEGFKENDFSFVNDFLTEEQISSKINETGKIIGKESLIEELSLLIFQLKDYIPALCNLTNMFLLSKNFDAVYFFTTKLFISHIGNINYQSSGSYNYMERFFDRFIEIVKNCNISAEKYIPFILEIFKSERVGGLTQWRAPAIEFMKTFYSENEEWVTSYLENDDRKFEMMNLLCLFNTQKGLSVALDYYSRNNQDEEKFLQLFKQNKKEVILHIDQKLNNAEMSVLGKFAKLLLEIDNGTDTKSRLEEIYKRSDDRALRTTIAQRIGLSENASFKNEKQFLFAVRRNIKEPQERVFGLAFDKFDLKFESGLKLDDACYTFLINLFKNDSNLLNLTKYETLKDVFDKQTLQEFLQNLYAVAFLKQDINASKWAVRMICLLSDDILTEKLYDFTYMLFDEGRVKEAKYLLSCLIASKKENVFEVIKHLALKKSPNFIPVKEEMLEKYAEFFDYDKEDLEDEMVPEIYDQRIYEKQKQRLFNSFISGRFYTKDYFERFFVNHPLFNKLAQNLIFGEYRYGRLHNAFVIENKTTKYIVAKPLESSDILISIVHPQDCDMRFQSAYNHLQNPTFNQFEEVLYDVKNFSRSSVSVGVFAGMMIKPYEFNLELHKHGFVINKEETSALFNSFIHVMPSLNLIAEIELEKNIQLSTPIMTVANLYFYRLSDVTVANGKYVTKKPDAIGIGSLPYRYFGYIMTSIINAVKHSK